VLLSYGHNALSTDSMRRTVFELSPQDAVFGHFEAVGGYALAARRAMHTFHTGPETWKHIAVGQRRWANLNTEAATHGEPLTFDDYYRSAWVAEPLRRADCCLITDGGRAVVITSAERARDLRQPAVLIMGMGQHNPVCDVHQAKHLAGPTGAKKSAETALGMAGITLADIDACEIYDCFTYTVEITLQDYGFFGPGEGEDWFKDGTIEPGGRMPVNTSGGQLSEAYYMGLTPLSEAAAQLMGRCGDRQLGPRTNTKPPEIILCSDNGAILQTHSSVILRRS
jgi:acetyl-CoA acetyltransferase